MSSLTPTQGPGSPRKKPSRIAHLARAAAISQANRERANAKTVPWLASEMKLIQQHYPDYAKLQELLPHRTLKQLKRFCFKYDVVNKRHVWTNKELDCLKNAVRRGSTAEEICALFPGFTRNQVYARATRLGLTWPTSSPKITGVPLIDTIRLEAHRRNLSMMDLDAICDPIAPRTYWQKVPRRISLPHVLAVLKYLDGKLEIVWNEEDRP